MNPAFEVARQTGNNLSRAFNQQKDTNAIEDILSSAMQSGNPEVLQNSIGRILSQVSPERQGAAVQYLQNAYQTIKTKEQDNKRREAYKTAGLNPDLPDSINAEKFKQNAKTNRINSVLGVENPNTGRIDPQSDLNNQQTNNQAVQNPQLPANHNLNNDNPFAKFSRGQLNQMAGMPDREISEGSKQQLKYLDEQDKINQKNKIAQRKELIDFHKETQKYDEDLIKNYAIARKQNETIDNIEEAIKSGNIKPSSLANIFKGFGKIGDKISEAIINKDEATLQSSIPQLLEGWKEVFGVRLTDADLRLLQDKMPSIGKNKEANLAVTKILRKYADMTTLRGEIARDIKKNNKDLRPLGYVDKIEERFEEMTSPVQIINPNNGKIISIPAYKLSDAINSGAKLAPQNAPQGAQNEL